MSVSLIVDQMDGNEDKVKMIYFLEYGLNYKLNENELMQKNWKELEHVLFMFKEKDAVCSRWKKRIEATAADRRSVYRSVQNTSLNTLMLTVKKWK